MRPRPGGPPRKANAAGLVEWLSITLWSRRRLWTQPQSDMMHAANRYHHTCRGLVAAVLLALLISAGIYEEREWEDMRSAARADQLVATLPLPQFPGY